MSKFCPKLNFILIGFLRSDMEDDVLEGNLRRVELLDDFDDNYFLPAEHTAGELFQNNNLYLFEYFSRSKVSAPRLSRACRQGRWEGVLIFDLLAVQLLHARHTLFFFICSIRHLILVSALYSSSQSL